MKMTTDIPASTTAPDKSKGKGKGGKFLVLPPDFKRNVPDGYFVVPSNPKARKATGSRQYKARAGGWRFVSMARKRPGSSKPGVRARLNM